MYIEDLISFGLPSQRKPVSLLLYFSLLKDLGLGIPVKKLISPNTFVVCLGILIDAVIPRWCLSPRKMQKLVHLCKCWIMNLTVAKKTLLGSLLYISKCVKPARAFLNRMLALLSS